MELWTCMMTEPDFGNTTLLGVFTTQPRAEEQARVWIEGVTDHKGEVNDREFDRLSDTEVIYYRVYNGRNYDHYTACIEKYILDEMSY